MTAVLRARVGNRPVRGADPRGHSLPHGPQLPVDLAPLSRENSGADAVTHRLAPAVAPGATVDGIPDGRNAASIRILETVQTHEPPA